jgi:hypothetical protein
MFGEPGGTELNDNSRPMINRELSPTDVVFLFRWGVPTAGFGEGCAVGAVLKNITAVTGSKEEKRRVSERERSKRDTYRPLTITDKQERETELPWSENDQQEKQRERETIKREPSTIPFTTTEKQEREIKDRHLDIPSYTTQPNIPAKTPQGCS